MPCLNFVVGYPKSGNTWVRMLVAAYALGPDGGYQSAVRYDDISKIDYQPVSPIPVSELGVLGEAMVRPSAMLMLARRQQSAPLVKSHHASTKVGSYHLWHDEWMGKIIYVVRDPRDVCCSAADHFGQTLEETVDFMKKSEANIGGDDKLHHVLGSWSDHVSSWQRSDKGDTYTVRYEDLHADTEGELKNIVAHLGIEFDEERAEAAIKATDFDRLQRLEEEQGFPEQSEHQDRFFRRGETGSWQDELPPELARQIEEDHADMMKKMGYL